MFNHKLQIIALPFVVLLVVLTLTLSQNPANPIAVAVAQGGFKAQIAGGGPGVGQPPQQVVLDKLPQETQASGAPVEVPPPGTGLTPAQEAALKQQAAQGVGAVKGSPDLAMAFPTNRAGDGELTPFTSVGFGGVSNLSNLFPSDMGLAVGSTYVLQLVNASIAVFSKSGVLQRGYPKSLQSFMGLPQSVFLFDPRALYDPVKNRFIVVIDGSRGPSQTNVFNVAVSATSDPRGTWNKYAFNYGTGTEFGDFPTLGQDGQGIYVCFNGFVNASKSAPFNGNKCFLFQKSKMYAGSAPVFWHIDGFTVNGTPIDTIQPANTSGSPRAEFMLNSFNINWGGGQCSGGCSGLVEWAVSNPFGFASGGPTPIVSGFVMSTSGYALPPNADAPGCANCVKTNDPRISGIVNYHDGSLFAAVPTAVNNGTTTVSGIRWWEVGQTLDDNGGGCTGSFTNLCPKITSGYLKQEGLYYYNGHESAYFPALMPDGDNNLYMVYNYSGGIDPPSVGYTARRVDYTPGSFHDGGHGLETGSGAITSCCQRWGDYIAAALDPSSKNPEVWISGMYSFGTNNWHTQIGDFFFNNRNLP